MSYRVVGAALTMTAAVVGSSDAQSRTLRTSSHVRQLQGETELSVHARFGVGEFTLARDAQESGTLFRGNVVFDERFFSAINRYDADERTLEIGTRTRVDDFDDADLEGQRLDLRLTPRVPVSLDLEFGAGKATVDLGGLKLQQLELATGASESIVEFSRPTTHACRSIKIRVGAADFTVSGLGNANCASLDVAGAAGSITLDFTGEWQLRDMRADIGLGLGGLTLRFPRDLGVAITLNRFLASFDDEGFVKRGNMYSTRGFEDAPARIRIDLKAIVGDVSVEWVN